MASRGGRDSARAQRSVKGDSGLASPARAVIASGMVGSSILDYWIDPSPVAFLVLLALGVGVLRLVLPKDRFYALAIGAFLAFLLAEAFCRTFDLVEPTAKPFWGEKKSDGGDQPYVPNSRLTYRYPSNPRGYFDARNRVLGRINSLGFRGPEVSREKDPNRPRIVVLGDSFTLGLGVRDEHTLPAQLERELTSRGVDAEVLNFGVTGADTRFEVNLLQRYALDFDPDVVVVVAFLNDAAEEHTLYYLSGTRLLRRVRKYSAFLDALSFQMDRWLLHGEMIRHYRLAYREDSPAWVEMRHQLERGRTLANRGGARFVVALYPILHRLDDRYPFREIHAEIGDFCASVSIPFVDLLPGFMGREASEMWVHPVDPHPNEIAHAIAARELADFLIRRRMLPPS